jgi:hypothetical protein
MIDFKSRSVKSLLLAAINSKGYKEVVSKTSRRHRVFKDDSGDMVIVSASANFQLYYNPCIYDDKGDVIRFLLNRAGMSINCRNSIKAYYKQIEDDLDMLGAYTFCPAPIEKKPFNWGYYQSFVSNFGNEVPDTILALLSHRGIPASVLTDPVLQPIQQFKNGNTGYCNIFFPFLNINGNVVGGQYKYLHKKETVKMNLPNSERERSLWHTSGTGKNSLFIVEDPLDAISYQLLYRKENLQYAATGGSITGNQVLQIQKISSQKQLILGNDSDFAGMFANLSIIEGKPVNKTINKNEGVATFKIDDEEYNMDFPNLKKFVIERAAKANIEIAVPNFDDWNEELKRVKKPV